MTRIIPSGYEDDLLDDFDYMGLGAEDYSLKIRVVPDCTSGACLNGENFDSSLSYDETEWFDTFQDQWNSYKRSPHVQQSFNTFLMNDEAPLLLALKLFANCPGCNNLKNKNLPLYILEAICDLYQQHPAIAASCDDNTRMIAFNLVKTCGIVMLYKAVMTTYDLRKIRLLLVPKLRELIALAYFKDAAYWAMYLDVTDEFGVFDIVFPLILQDKAFLGEEYLSTAKEQQLPTVQFLDSLLDNKKTVKQHCDEILAKYINFDIKHDVLSYRPMSKLVTRLAKKYKIDEQYTPNLVFSKTCSYLHYLHRKYLDGGMSRESWRELVNDTATTVPLQADLVVSTLSHGDLSEAVYWAHHFKLPPSECPLQVESRMRQSASISADSSVDTVDSANQSSFSDGTGDEGELAANAQVYLTLTLPVDRVLLVESKVKFLEMISYLGNQELIGFDSEWKPSHSNNVLVSLLQLATDDRVFLVDCQSPAIVDEQWAMLGDKIFNNQEILKIGFSLSQDLQMLQKSLTSLQLNLQLTSCYLDLRELWRRLKYMQIVNLPYTSHCGVGGQSLSALSEVCLGKKLDKSNQCSNWAKRPLRRDQIMYAALDAHCLLLIYQVFAETLLRAGVDINEVVDEITSCKRGMFRTRRNGHARNAATQNGRSQSHAANGEHPAAGPSGACDIKFICDKKLLHLMRELRKLGLDTVQMFDSSDVKHYVRMAKRENRVLLASDEHYSAFAKELPRMKCILIPEDTCVNQALNILALLSITVQERDLYTRCAQCNCNAFILANREEMQMMCFGHLIGVERRAPLLPPCNPFDKTYQLVKTDEHVLRTKTTNRGKPIKYRWLKSPILRTKHHFYICDNCGACTWDGAYALHWTLRNAALGCGATQQNGSRRSK